MDHDSYFRALLCAVGGMICLNGEVSTDGSERSSRRNGNSALKGKIKQLVEADSPLVCVVESSCCLQCGRRRRIHRLFPSNKPLRPTARSRSYRFEQWS